MNTHFIWVTRSFLDYRIPVYRELSKLADGNLTVIYNGDYVPQRAQNKLSEALGPKAVPLHGELRLGRNQFGTAMANRAIRIPWQPGLLREAQSRSPTVLISDGFFQWTAACVWLRRNHGIPHVMCYERTAHTERHAQWYRRLYRNWALRHIDAICCSGKLCGDYVRSIGFPAEKITYGHMVADVAGVSHAAAAVTKAEAHSLRDKHAASGLVFLYVGRLVRAKGIQELLRAWAAFTEGKNPGDFTLILVGDGPDRMPCEAFCESHRLRNVRFIGAVDYDSVVPYYVASDYFVIPTLEDNWSLVVSEAMACGLPILCSVYNGCWPELVQDGLNGWTFDPLSRENALQALRSADLSRAHLPRMRRESISRVSTFTAHNAARQILRACDIAGSRVGAFVENG